MNGFVCKILSAFEVSVNQARIIHFDDVKTLVVERFDRHLSENKDWILRLSQEDLCQALGISDGVKYESDGAPGMQDIMGILLDLKVQVRTVNSL